MKTQFLFFVKSFPVVIFCILFQLPVFNSLVAQAEAPEEKAANDSLSLFQSLNRDDILHMHVKTDLRNLIRKKAKKENHMGVLTLKEKDGTETEWDIKIRARGNMRNKICFLPPLRIDFVKGDLTAKGLKRQFDDFKLVVRCKGGDLYEDFVLREFLAYKMYNMLTDMSFRVQLAKLTMEDTEGKQKSVETYAFIIEKDDELAARLNGKVLETRYMKRETLLPELFDLMCVYQFMIGNTDWHVLNKHNLKVFRSEDYNHLIPIPFDFDYAGIVGTPYAVPHEKLPMESVMERYFLGPCRPPGTYEPIIQLFRDKKSEILEYCEAFPHLSDKSKKSLMRYLNDFFDILDNPKSVERLIVDHCDQEIKVPH